jgi:DNA polymerase-3 subunit delta'
MSDGFDAIQGQDTAVRTLRRALETGRVHHAYRFEGPPGVGKEMAAFALARALVCEAGRGCGQCSACRRAVTFTDEEPRVPLHPDVVLVQRALYPPSLLGSTSTEATGIGVDQIRKIVLSRAGYRPHEGRALVFIVRDADELTVQAANALLKTLEEPPSDTHFVLLTSRPNRLLDTVRSRTLAVRFGALSDEVLTRIAERLGLPLSVVALAQGSASLAVELADPEALGEREAFVSSAEQALRAPDLAQALDALSERPTERHLLRHRLLAFAQALASEARRSAAADECRAARAAARHQIVLTAIDEVEKNVSPALALEAMVMRLRRA